MTDRYPLNWIDEYILNIREYVFVREEDNLLIKVPNEAFRLNDSGISILKRLFAGESIDDLWASFGKTDEVRKDLYDFVIGIKQMLQGCVNEKCLPGSVDVVRFDLGFSTLPVLSEVALTYRCNLSCRFCYAGCSCSVKQETGRDMDTEQVKRVLDIIRNDAQVPSVSFTGGEPTLRNDLCDLVSYAARIGLRVNLITNGTMITENYVRDLKDAGLKSAQVSLEGTEADIHDSLTQKPGSFEKTLEAVKLFRDAGMHVHTNTTLNSVNLENAYGMPSFVHSLGLKRFSMNLMIPAGTGRESDDIHLKYSELPRVLERISSEAEENGVEFMWYSPVPVCIFNTVSHGMGNKGCAACDGLLSVSPRGEVLPCSSWAEPVGSLLEEDFRHVWNSARAVWMRKKEFAPGLCRQCEDFALCQNACPLYWDYHGFKELQKFGEKYVSSCPGT